MNADQQRAPSGYQPEETSVVVVETDSGRATRLPMDPHVSSVAGEVRVQLTEEVTLIGQPRRVLEALILAAAQVARSAGLPVPLIPPF